MIQKVIATAPIRLSLGSADYPTHIQQYGGASLGLGLDHRVEIEIRRNPDVMGYKSKIIYSETEIVNDNKEIKHKVIREALKFFKVDFGIELIHKSSLPSRLGLGTSSAFAVALVGAVSRLIDLPITPIEIWKYARYIEVDVCGITCGYNDYLTSTYSNIHFYHYPKIGAILKHQIELGHLELKELQDNILLLYTGEQREASSIAASFATNEENWKLNKKLTQLCWDARYHLEHRDLACLGKTISQGWEIKKQLSSQVSNEKIDNFYNRIIRTYGVKGARLLGAGSNGVFLILCAPEYHHLVCNNLSELKKIETRLDNQGLIIQTYA